MKYGKNAFIALACFAALGFASGAASADDVLVVRVPVQAYPRVPRVKPASPTKEYPFGVLREDYTPYGMAGVPARLYFDAIGKRRTASRSVVRAAY
jgi:hypothetical protein